MLSVPRWSLPLLLWLLSGPGDGATAWAQEAPARVRRGSLESWLVEKGVFEAVRARDVKAPGARSGELRLVFLVEEGTTVATGDTVARFDPSDAVRALWSARSELESERAEFDRLRAEQGARSANLESSLRASAFAAEQAALRLQRLRFASRAEREAAEVARRKAEIDHESARVELQTRAILDSLDRVKAQTRIEQAEQTVRAAQEELEQRVLVAPIGGLVIHGVSGRARRPLVVGDIVWPRQTVVRLPDLRSMRVVARVHELDRAEIEVGQEVRVRAPAVPDLRVRGHIRSIAELAQPLQDDGHVRVFEFHCDLEESDPRLRPGMSARVEVCVGRREDTLIAPREALADSSTVIDLRGRRHRVRVGLVTPLEIEILEGVSEGQPLRRTRPREQR